MRLFYNIVNSGKIGPNIQPSDASGNIHLTSYHWPQLYHIPLSIFPPPVTSHWASDGEICCIFGSYLLLESQEGARVGNRNPIWSCVRRCFLTGTLTLTIALKSCYSNWSSLQKEKQTNKRVLYIFIQKNELIHQTTRTLAITESTNWLVWGSIHTSSTCIFLAWNLLTLVSLSSLRSISSKYNQVKKEEKRCNF